MPREFSRKDRLAEAVQRELAELIRHEVRDPRLALINVTGVEVSRDFSSAKVFVNFIEPLEEQEHRERIAVLNKASGFLRSQLMHRVRLRITPKLTFFYDDSGDRGRHLSALIDSAVAKDHSASEEQEDK